MTFPTKSLLALALAVAAAAPAAGTSVFLFPLQSKMTASDGAATDLFGISVAVDGDVAVVGAEQHDRPGAVNAGEAYVFERSGTTWTQTATLVSSDPAPNDDFGYAVAVNGTTIVVSEHGDNNARGPDAGAVHVYAKSGTSWVHQAKLVASDGALGDVFGWSLALDGDRLLVGARGDDTNGPHLGRAYVFDRAGGVWTQSAELFASDGSAADDFAISVALSGDVAVVGAFLDDTPAGVDAGSAYVFERSGSSRVGWQQAAKLVASDAAPGDRFGIGLAASGDRIVVGAPMAGHASLDGLALDAAPAAGSVYAFTRGDAGWTQSTKLVQPLGEADARFGVNLALAGDTLVVGAPGARAIPVLGAQGGAAYVFNVVRLPVLNDVWALTGELLAEDAAAGDAFGYPVAIGGSSILIGATGVDALGAGAGAAYAFQGAP